MHSTHCKLSPRRLAALGALLLTMLAAPAQAQDAFIGEVRLFAGNFAPSGWAFADGSLVSINDNEALFSLIGTTYGGDGISNFGLPDLRGRAPVAVGAGPGLSPRSLGQLGGAESVTLTGTQLPVHTHSLVASSTGATTSQPAAGSLLAATQNGGVYAEPTTTTALSPVSVGASGGNQPVDNRQPYLVLNYIIALWGIYPSRP